MPDLAEAIRVHMRDGGQPISFDEIAGRAAVTAASPTLRRKRRFSRARALGQPGHAPRSLRVPAIAWASLLAIVLAAVIIGVSVSGNRSPSPVSPTHHGGGPQTSVPPVNGHKALVVPNVVAVPATEAVAELRAVGLKADKQLIPSPVIPAGEVEAQSPAAGTVVAGGSVIDLRVSTGPGTSQQSASTPLGIFTDGSEGQPYYFISLFGIGGSVGSTPPRQVEGSLDFLYQDGQSSVVFTFDGTWSGTSLTMHPMSFPKAGASVTSGSIPQTIQATTVSDVLGIIRLPNCSDYLRLATSTRQCEFVTGETTIGDSGPRPSLATYSDGAIGTPHYVVTITTSTGDEVDGSIDYLDQNGRITRAISFFGLFQGSIAVITERQLGLSAPSISVLFADREFGLGECFDYLTSIQSNAQCTFDQTG